jgi:EmrB/QacA subfamily drug resistance transporter
MTGFPPSPAEPRPRLGRPLLVLIAVSAPSFMLQLDTNIVAVSLPSIAQSLKANFAGIEWVITAYTLSFASLMLPAGTLADRFGRRRMLAIGLGLFTFASFLCGAAPSLSLLVAARALQGVGAALQLSAGLASLSSAFEGDARARAFAFWGSVVGAGISLGPIVGGFITQSFGWQWAFYINLPIGVATIALTLAVIPETRDPHARRLDWAGVTSFGAFLFLTTLALISGNHDGWSAPHIQAELAGAAAFLALFITVELRQERPMLDLSFFRKPTYLGANLAQLAFAAGLLTMLTFLPIYFQSGLGLAPRAAGLLMLPLALPLFIVPRIVTTRLAHRLSGRALLTLGLMLVSAGLAWMGLVAPRLDGSAMLPGMLLAGIGAGLLNGETTKVGMIVIPPERAGMASGVSGTMRFTGIVIGFAALGVVLFGRIAAAVETALPMGGAEVRQELARKIASGDFVTSPLPGLSAEALRRLATDCFGLGYQALLLSAAAIAGSAALATWCLVRALDTRPIGRPAERRLAPPSLPPVAETEG